jgi:hypothetical protein
MAVAFCLVVAALVVIGRGWGDGKPSARADVQAILPAVVSYLDHRYDHEMSPSAGPMFCGVRSLGGVPAGQRVTFFVWEACQEYQARRGHLVEQTGWSLPAAITAVRSGAGYRIVEEEQEFDGGGFAHAVPSESVQREIYALDGSSKLNPLFAEDKRQAERRLLGK